MHIVSYINISKAYVIEDNKYLIDEGDRPTIYTMGELLASLWSSLVWRFTFEPFGSVLVAMWLSLVNLFYTLLAYRKCSSESE